MINCTDERLVGRWFPVARSEDAVPHHVFHGRLLGQELAVWRGDDGTVNVWENRCPHRGTRLTIGTNRGNELACRYHGWRFAKNGGQCTFIPATPNLTPPKVACAKAYMAREKAGLIWVNLGAAGGEPATDALSGRDRLPLRDIVVRASAPAVAEALMGYRFVPSTRMADPGASGETEVERIDPFTLVCTATAGDARETLVFMVQPTDATKATIHGIVQANIPEADRIAVLRYHNDQLSALRNRIESEGHT